MFHISTKIDYKSLWQSVAGQLFVILFTLIFFTQITYSQELKAKAGHREVLYTVAFEQMSFILNTLTLENSFTDKLSADEKKMLDAIIKSAEQNATYHWLKKNSMPNIHNPFDTFYYVVSKHSSPMMSHENSNRSDAYVSYATAAQYPLQFSSDQKLFNLNSQEPIRSAVTYYVPPKAALPNHTDIAIDKEPIYVNSVQINNLNNPQTFTDAIEILIHEFGHKVGQDIENTAAVNSLAAKVKGFIENNYRKTNGEHSATRIYFYQFPLKALQHWVNGLHEGYFQGVNMGFNFEALRIFDNAGTYIFSETDGHVEFLNPQVFTKNTPRIFLNRFNKVDWSILRFNRIYDLEISEKENSIQINFSQKEDVTPLLLPSKKINENPAREQEVTNYVTFGDVPLTFTTINSISIAYNPQLEKNKIIKKIKMPYITDPATDVITEADSRSGNNLTVELRVTGGKKYLSPENEFALKFYDESNNEYELKNTSARVEENDLIVKFQYYDFYLLNRSFTATYIEISKKPNVASLFNQTTKTRLTLNKPLILESRNENTTPQTQANTPENSSQTQRHQKTNSLQLLSFSKVANDSHMLRFTFRSKAKLNSLTLKLQTTVQRTQYTQMQFNNESQRTQPYVFVENSNEIEVLIGTKQMSQNQLSENTLEVTVDLRKVMELNSKNQNVVLSEYNFTGNSLVTEFSEALAQNHWQILALKAVNANADMTDFMMREPKLIAPIKASTNSKTPLQCLRLFDFN